MKKILFRGKSLYSGRWLYGYVQEFVAGQFGPKNVCVCCSAVTDYESAQLYAVDPSTIGQYIGRNDSHGNEIFEGDIIIANDKYLKVINYNESRTAFCMANVDELLSGITDPYTNPDDSWWREIDTRVVGNIHEVRKLVESNIINSTQKSVIDVCKRVSVYLAQLSYPKIYKNVPVTALMHPDDATNFREF